MTRRASATRPAARLVLALLLPACGVGDGAQDFPGDTGARIKGLVHPCPTIGSFTATPMRTGIGQRIELTSSASPEDVPPDLSFVWLARAGSFDDPSARNTVYTCEAIGVQELTLIVTDGTCGDYVDVPVECVAEGS